MKVEGGWRWRGEGGRGRKDVEGVGSGWKWREEVEGKGVGGTREITFKIQCLWCTSAVSDSYNTHIAQSTCNHQQVLGSIVVSISACHAEDPGSIPGRGECFFFLPSS